MSSSSNQPNKTLYINNLNDKVNKEELRIQLLALFATYGKIIDIVASKSQKMKGQAFLVFTDLASATSAMRACEGMMFYDKPLHIDYAKTKSFATLRNEDPNFVAPTPAAHASAPPAQNGKRSVDNEAGSERPKKRGRDDNSDEEMEIEDEDAPQKDTSVPIAVPSQAQQPTARLLCQNLPQEVTDDVLAVLFQQYKGFQRTHVAWSPNLNPQGIRVKMGQVFFETAELATTARDALDGFTLKKGWQMSIAYI